MKNTKKLQIGVIGTAGSGEYKDWKFPDNLMEKAEEVGELLGARGAILITGGKDGIMEAASRGAKKSNGLTIGVIKGSKRSESNKFIDVEVLSGMQADGLDELLIVLMCDALIVLGGGAGTLQEISIAYRNKKPIVAISGTGGWCDMVAGSFLDGRNKVKIECAKTPREAVEKAISLAKL